MLFDALAYIMAFAASYIADRYDASEQWSHGLHRLEPTAAFFNGVLLIPMVGPRISEGDRVRVDT